ncbi:hypothetical protein LCGC14_2480230, partial [marine sediment metagenome]
METINNEPKETKEPLAEKKVPVKRRKKTIGVPPSPGKNKEISSFQESKDERYKKVLDNFGRTKLVDRHAKEKRLIHPDQLDETKRKWDSQMVTGVFK